MKTGCFKAIGALTLLCTAAAQADTIRLKNGRTILADSVRETEKRVEYTIGDNTFAIPRASVDRIDTRGIPVVTARSDAPLPVEAPPLAFSLDLSERVIRDGKVDIERLAAIEGLSDPGAAAAANFIAAQHERGKGGLEAAARYLERARTFLPENDVLLGNHASLLLQLNRFSEAAVLAERAVRIAPNVGFHYAVLGYAQYNQGKMKEALRSLKRSLELQPDPRVAALLIKAEREDKAESTFDEQASSHFKMRYEGGNAPGVLRRQILDTLEAHFQDLVRELDFSPREDIHVILYTDRQFFNITRAPAWTGAVNDGKIRMPVSGLQAVDTELSRILRHELVHSFVNQITRGRAPTWLHEGAAQVVEGATTDRDGRRLAALYGSGRAIPINELEGSFMRFSPAEAAVAYSQSLASVEYIRDVYGMSSVTYIMKRMGEGQSTEAAMRSVIHSGYGQLQREITDWLKRRYPE